MSDPMLTAALQTLLQGEVICSIRYKTLFDYLDDERNLESVNQTLTLLGREVRLSTDRDAYLCCYTNISSPEVVSACKERFRRIVQDMQPLVQWMCILMDSNPTGTPIRPNDSISKVDILKRIEQSQGLCDRLATLASNKVFKSTSQDPQGQLQQILNKLVDMGYFIVSGHASTRYQATGKWSVLYDQLGFIRSYEALEVPEDMNQVPML